MAKNLLVAVFISLLIFSTCSPKDQTQTQTDSNDFTLPSLDGEDITLSKLKGHVILIDFWATWCPPCRKSIPVFIDLYNKYHEKGFTVLGISREDKSVLEKFRDEIGIPYPLLIDNNGISKKYQVQAIPTIMIFDKNGKVRKTQVGFAPELEAGFDLLIDSLLSE